MNAVILMAYCTILLYSQQAQEAQRKADEQAAAGESLLGSRKYAEATCAFEAGLALDPSNAACLQGIQRTQVLYCMYIMHM